MDEGSGPDSDVEEGQAEQGRRQRGPPADGQQEPPPQPPTYRLACSCGFHELPQLRAASPPPPEAAAAAAAGAAEAEAAPGPGTETKALSAAAGATAHEAAAVATAAAAAAAAAAAPGAGGAVAAVDEQLPDLPMEIIHKIFTHADAGTVCKAAAATAAQANAAASGDGDGAAVQPPAAKRARIEWAPPPSACLAATLLGATAAASGAAAPAAEPALGAAAAAAAAGGGAAAAGTAHLLLLSDAALRAKQEAELVCFFRKAAPGAATWVSRSQPLEAGSSGGGDDNEAGSGGSAAAGAMSRQAGHSAAPAAKGDRLDTIFYSWDQRAPLPAELDVLGVGIDVDWHERSGAVRTLSMTHDTLSLAAFVNDRVRRSAWNQPFNAFLPLAVNAAHGRVALRVLRHSVADVLRLPHARHVRAEHLLDVVGRLMNSLVVDICTPPKEKEARDDRDDFDPMGLRRWLPSLPRHMSDAALQSFCHLHHLLLTLVVEGDGEGEGRQAASGGSSGSGSGGGGGGSGLGRALLEVAARDVSDFIARPEARRKSSCPDLGLLLVKFLLVPRDVAPWAAFAPPFVRELLSRQVRWVVKGLAEERPPADRAGGYSSTAAEAAAAFERPWEGGGDRRHAQRHGSGGREGTAAADATRLRQHFQHARTSLSLVALQAFFANRLARPSSSAAALQQLAAIKASYDLRNGQPPAPVFEAFNAHARSVIAQRGWEDFLSAVRMGVSAQAVAAGAGSGSGSGGGSGSAGSKRAVAAAADAAVPAAGPANAATAMVGGVARVMADTLRQAVVDAHRAGYQDSYDGRRGGGYAGGGGYRGGGYDGRSRWDRDSDRGGQPPRHLKYVDWDGPSPPLVVVGSEW